MSFSLACKAAHRAYVAMCFHSLHPTPPVQKAVWVALSTLSYVAYSHTKPLVCETPRFDTSRMEAYLLSHESLDGISDALIHAICQKIGETNGDLSCPLQTVIGSFEEELPYRQICEKIEDALGDYEESLKRSCLEGFPVRFRPDS